MDVSNGALPATDYLSDAGQTRMLGYSLPADRSQALALCARLLNEVYEMSEEDVLCFDFSPNLR